MEGKVVMVTGAAAGIGLACAEAFAKAGAIVVLADIKEPKELVRKLVSDGYKASLAGGRCIFYTLIKSINYIYHGRE